MQREVGVIIPVYNEAKIIKQTISDVLKVYPVVICVNDGSTDSTSAEIRKTKAILIEHPINIGQGGALQTGLEFGLQFPKIKYFVTFDADGQHNIKDTEKMIKILRAGDADIVLGSRFLGKAQHISRTKRSFLRCAVWFTNRLSGVRLTDTHNGLRACNRKVAAQLNITMPGMAHASEIIDKIGYNKWKYKEVPATITYSDYSKSKGQSMLNSVNIVIDLLMSKVAK